MSIELDYTYLERLLKDGVIAGSAIEMGSRIWPESYGPGNAESLCRKFGVDWTGTDIEEGPGVDIVLDLLDTDSVKVLDRQWDAVLVMNLLEHVYDPISVLRNCCEVTAPGGVCVVVGPVVWRIHDYPQDFWRPLPDFFLEFARREGMTTDTASMHWLTLDRLIPVDELTDGQQKCLPGKFQPEPLFGAVRSKVSHLVHFAFNTYGRDCFFPEVGLGVVLRKPASG